MKFRNLLMASAVALLGFTSCSNNDVIESNEPVAIDGDLRIKLDVASVTRTPDNKVKGGDKAEIKTVDIYLSDGVNVIRSVNLENEDLKNLGQGRADELITFNNVSGCTEVVLVANKVATAPDKETTKLFPIGTPISKVKEFTTVIQNIQPKTGDGVKNAPMFGSTNVIEKVASEVSASGKELYQAIVKLAPVISRVQVFGEIAHNKDQVKNLKVTKIFLDNVLTQNNPEEKLNVGTTADNDETEKLTKLLEKYTFFDVKKEGLTSKDASYAYHIFPQNENVATKPKDKNVKLILEIQYQVEDAEGKDVDKTEYATLRFATANNTIGDAIVDEKVITIEEAKIYNIDLGRIDWDGNGHFVDPTDPENPDEDKDIFEPGDGGETPNSDQVDLKVLVEVLGFTEVNIIPQN